MRLFRFRYLALALATAVFSSALVSSPIATAASSKTIDSGTVAKDFTVTGTFSAKGIGRCLMAFLSGTVTANWSVIQAVPSYTNGYSNDVSYALHSPQLHHPRLAVLAYNKCGTGRKAKKLTQLTFRQTYYGTRCTASMSIGVSGGPTGWSVGLSVTPSCGKVIVAKRESFSQVKSSGYSQSNTGTVVKWSGLDRVAATASDAKNMKVCIDPFVYLNAAVGSDFDNGNVNFKALCVKYPG